MAAEKEIWIEFTEGYQVSSLGNIRSLDRYVNVGRGVRFYKGKRLSAKGTINGYPVVNIKRKVNKIHQVVAKTFIPNPEGLPVINHKNGIKSDNRVSNLEWCTHQENCLHAFKHKLREPAINKEGKNGFSKKVKNIKTGRVFESVTQTIRLDNVTHSYSAFKAMLNGQNPNKTHYKYI